MAIMQNFKHPQLGEIRVLEIDGAPWFVGKDIAAALEYGDTDKALRNRVEEADKLTRPIDGSGQNRNMILVNERGMYSLAFSSRRSCARAFQDWMMNDIMPALHLKKKTIVRRKMMFLTAKTLKPVLKSEKKFRFLAIQNLEKFAESKLTANRGWSAKT